MLRGSRSAAAPHRPCADSVCARVCRGRDREKETGRPEVGNPSYGGRALLFLPPTYRALPVSPPSCSLILSPSLSVSLSPLSPSLYLSLSPSRSRAFSPLSRVGSLVDGRRVAPRCAAPRRVVSRSRVCVAAPPDPPRAAPPGAPRRRRKTAPRPSPVTSDMCVAAAVVPCPAAVVAVAVRRSCADRCDRDCCRAAAAVTAVLPRRSRRCTSPSRCASSTMPPPARC